MEERFTYRWALLLTVIGIAISTGNIWRFPRVAAQNGVAVFLIPWMLFLFLWCIPFILVEVGMGKMTRMGKIGAFGKLNGKFTWMGGFIGFCTPSITIYYCGFTVCCFRYAAASLIDIVMWLAELPLGGSGGATPPHSGRLFRGASWLCYSTLALSFLPPWQSSAG
ncbi:MAG: hypothetical protein GF417_02185 [Candidatus Latescibacteria bacterium]|nr:hypothetical protein [bacterium]MBD3423238.1 hypothetical protein [Candidatus Latescibacterota bacterium]